MKIAEMRKRLDELACLKKLNICEAGLLLDTVVLLDELKVFETTEAVRELCAAERNGKLWIMPCKRGDTVYRFVGAKGRKRVEPREVMSVTKYGTTVTVYTTTEDVLGKTVFLTKPEALAALAASAGKE